MKNAKKYIGVACMGIALLAFPSCSDWDDHYSAGEGTSATKTLWEIINETPKLSRFRDIAEKSSYYRDEDHPQEGYTFKDMLNGSMLITAWVPENDAFTEEEYQKWMNLAETRGYAVQQQLMGNSIALYRQVATGGGINTLTMLNGKKMQFDKNQFAIQDLPLLDKNIAATNGTLHTIGQVIPFRYNLYEYLKDATNAQENNVSLFHDFVIKNDTTYFSENSSIEGNPDADGNPTYVDSVYMTTNTLFMGTHRFPSNTSTEKYLTYDEGFGANIIGEDSTYIMLYPTDQAWESAKEKLASLYNYAHKYVDSEKRNQNTKDSYRTVEDPDSLKEKCLAMDIASPLVFNLHMQPNSGDEIGKWKLNDFMAEKGQSASYFLNTFGDTLRSDANWDKSTLFEGKQLDLSNGVAIVKDNWDFPIKFYQPDINIEIGYESFFNVGGDLEGSNAAPISFSNATAEAWVDTVGRIYKNNFYYIYPKTASKQAKFTFRLVGTSGDSENEECEVMSGKYEIGLVLVPNFYITSKDTINGDTVKHKLQCTLNYCIDKANGEDQSITSDTIDYNGQKVDTLWLRFPPLLDNFTPNTKVKDNEYLDYFQFPYSYKNLRHCYPTLTITTATKSNDRKPENGYSNFYCIDRIIMRSKE